MTIPKLAIVIPCYNESEALPITVARLIQLLDDMFNNGLVTNDSYILCCDDGSKDSTWKVIERLHMSDKRIKGISLAHNRGHQYALLAGLMCVKENCDAAVSIDADLQDDPQAICKMVKEFIYNDKEIVYGVRSSRKTDSWFKRNSAHAFYNLQRRLGLDTVFDHADYRLMSRRSLELLADYGECNLFLRGIIPQIGLDTAIIEYERKERIAGHTKYPIGEMVSLSIDGITSFSAKPIRLIFALGLIFLILDISIAIYVLSAYFNDDTISGWTSLMLSVWFIGSIILMGIGIVGEYIGKIFMEVKHRPRYAVKDKLID